jgi:hypothetical protein
MSSWVLPRQVAVRAASSRKTPAGLWYLLAGGAFFLGYFRLSTTYPENSDMANILLMGADLLHGNLLLHGWHMSDVAFYPTELVQYALLESVFGLHMTTAHVAAAMTYTLVVLLTILLARGGTNGREALVRTLIAGGIVVAPQLSVGVYAVDVAVGHIGTSVPLLLAWLILDRAGSAAPAGRPRSPAWRVPALLTVILAWVLVADPIVEITGIAPLALVAGSKFAWRLAHRRGLDWTAAALACAALAAFGLAWAAQAVFRALGGYIVSPLHVHFRSLAEWPAAGSALWKVLALFGADFHGMKAGVPLVLAIAHLVSVALVVIALTMAARPGVPLVDQVLAVGTTGNLALYLGTLTSVQGAHEIAVALPYAAALAGRLLAPVLLAPPLLAARTGGGPGGATQAATVRARGGPGAWWTGASGWGRTCAVSGALLLCGYLAGLGYELTYPSSPPANSALASWLVAHGFRSGLATYWQASSVTVDTGDQVTVRAVTGRLSPYLWMTDTAWYDPGRDDAGFLILQHPPESELIMLHQRFGPPARTYQVDGDTVLTWRRNLLSG